MTLWNWFVSNWEQLQIKLYPRLPKQDNPQSMSSDLAYKAPPETLGESLRKKIYSAGDCDLHDILSETIKTESPDWHLKIEKNDKAIDITRRFHQEFENLNKSSNLVDSIDIIEETFSKFKHTGQHWDIIKQYLQDARERNDPESVIKAYTCTAEFTKYLNNHLATNAYHFIRLYCTILNCPALYVTKEYTEAFTQILFHPKLDKYFVRKSKVYRGVLLKDTKLMENYKVGATILTTTFLSTSKNPNVAEMFYGSAHENQISVFKTYNIYGTPRRSALNIEKFSQFPDEEEVLILRYVPFTITSIEKVEDGRRINICLDEFLEETSAPNRSEPNDNNSVQVEDNRIEPKPAPFYRTRDELNSSCSCNNEIEMNSISYSITEFERTELERLLENRRQT
ncbi:unnamed protein product [Rotaria sp. Silwood1]|nr:unnamed protein product [Rotaria sp. Silwood1]